MQVKDLVRKLQQANQEAQVNVHLTQGDIQDTLSGLEYVLAEPAVVFDTGWDGLITIEIGEIVGEG